MYTLFKSNKRKKLEKEGLASSKTRQKSSDTLTAYANTSLVIKVFIFGLLWVFLALVLVFPSLERKSEFYLVLNQLAPKTIYADFNFSYLDSTETSKQKELASLSVPLIYQIDELKSNESINSIYEFLKNFPEESDTENLQKIKELYELDEETIGVLNKFKNDNKRLELFRSKLSGIIYKGIISSEDISDIQDPDSIEICIINKNKHIRNPIPAALISTTKDAAKKIADAISVDYPRHYGELLKKVIYAFSLNNLKPNLLFDQALTDVEKQFVTSSERHEVFQQVRKGEIVIKKGQKIDESSLERFNCYENERAKRDLYANFLENFSYNLAMSFVLLIITIVYFYKVHKKPTIDNQGMVSVVFVLIISLVTVFLSMKLFNVISSEFNIPGTLTISIIPLALAPILLTVVIGIRGAIFGCILISLIAAIKVDNYYAMVIGMALGCFTSLLIQSSRNYKSFFLKSIVITFITLLPAELLCFLQPIITNVKTLLIPLVALCFINAFMTGIIALAVLFFIESFFHMTTDMSLQALCDYNHPLLKKLQIEAPGTYHHSLMVATIAEHAAIEIELNPIRTRACALFHDIGKLSRPEYFTENNSNSSELHSALKHGMSAMIITSHVKDGTELALKYKLGRLVNSAIEQHHGTDIVYFFYQKALEQSRISGSGNVFKKEFMYPGPKPISKEVTLVSLADSCEAASRSLEKPTASRVETLVWEIIKKKIQEGQFDNSELSLEELSRVRLSFTKTLTSMMHTRINYQSNTKESKEDESLLFNIPKSKPVNT